jgi:murein DD-endopeptidase MepM/ murein hydrolase activator NlpD
MKPLLNGLLAVLALSAACVDTREHERAAEDVNQHALAVSGYAGPGLRLPMRPGSAIYVTTQAGDPSDPNNSGHRGNSHFSLDFDDRLAGDLVVAAAAGVVTEAVVSGCVNQGATCLVVIDHGGGYTTRYLHMANGTVQVAIGQQVVQGQVLGTIGNTGISTGSHLHFELKYDGAGNDGNPRLEGAMLDGLLFENYRDGSTYSSSNSGTTAYTHAGTKLCNSLSGPNPDWTYNCVGAHGEYLTAVSDLEPQIFAGSRVYALTHLTSIRPYANHRFKVEVYRDREHQWGWETGANEVGGGGWQHAYFWPDIGYTAPGTWEFRIYVDAGEGVGFVYVGFRRLRVVPPPVGYVFDGADACLSIEGPDANWIFRCTLPSDTFPRNLEVKVLFRLRDIWRDHRFKARVYRDNVFAWETAPTDWNRVDPLWGWRHAYHWPSIPNASPGSWRVELYVDDGAGFRLAGSKSFTVTIW